MQTGSRKSKQTPCATCGWLAKWDELADVFSVSKQTISNVLNHRVHKAAKASSLAPIADRLSALDARLDATRDSERANRPN
jgi:hypothetical protein